jgi:hypothetical protein
MFFVAFIVLLWNPRRPVPIVVGAVSVVLLALTSPFSLLLAARRGPARRRRPLDGAGADRAGQHRAALARHADVRPARAALAPAPDPPRPLR